MYVCQSGDDLSNHALSNLWQAGEAREQNEPFYRGSTMYRLASARSGKELLNGQLLKTMVAVFILQEAGVL